jgi:hypothetical protein
MYRAESAVADIDLASITTSMLRYSTVQYSNSLTNRQNKWELVKGACKGDGDNTVRPELCCLMDLRKSVFEKRLAEGWRTTGVVV